MNDVTQTAHYSLEPLDGDDWETRRTKQIVRAIRRLKDAEGITTELIAERCSNFLAPDAAVKPATIKGIFAGKRKSISTAELEMFAAVLAVEPLDLLYPEAEMIEYAPGVFANRAELMHLPQPWQEARPGEVWLLTYGGRPTPHVYTDRTLGGRYAFFSDRAVVSADDPDITDGKRLWPVEGVQS